jgi:hypothetical protein
MPAAEESWAASKVAATTILGRKLYDSHKQAKNDSGKKTENNGSRCCNSSLSRFEVLTAA